MRLDTLARFGKYYRLYGVAGKGWRGLVVIQLIRHMFSRSPEAQTAWLQSQLESKEEEMRELEREGIPSLIIDADHMDRRNFSTAQFQTRADAFMESLLRKKGYSL